MDAFFSVTHLNVEKVSLSFETSDGRKGLEICKRGRGRDVTKEKNRGEGRGKSQFEKREEEWWGRHPRG